MLTTNNSSYPFVPTNVTSGISNLQFTITIISFWMSSNYLTLQALKYVYLNVDMRSDLVVRSVSVRLFILRVKANKWHFFLNQEVILNITGNTNTLENNFLFL